jgi:hypothetical protein
VDEDERYTLKIRPSQLPEQTPSAIDERELDDQFSMPDDDPLRRFSQGFTG